MQTSESRKAVVSRYSELLFGVVDGGDTFTVAFLPGRIALCGTPGHQFFLNPGNVPAERLSEVIKGRDDLIKRAVVHKETTTDRTKFFDSIDLLLKDKILDGVGRAQLRSFIMKCDCPPRRIKEKLKAMGYGHILPKLDFERFPDELMTTIEAMEKFLDGVRETTTEAPSEPSTRATRARAAVHPALNRGPAGRS